MTRKQLGYDRAIVAQETSYWCGPASAQVVLNSRGIYVEESVLAREIGTTWNGTDHIGQIERVLDQRVPEARYTSVQMPNDPPTDDQRARLWRDIVRSIDAGWGVIVNIVAPPSNYPRAVAPSTISPAYSGGTVYHYMTVMGYDDAGARSVWIADSGFWPYGYWLGFDQLATLIPPKGYAYADVEPASDPTPTPAPPRGMDVDTLARAMGGTVSRERYAALLPTFTAAMREAGCTTVERAAMWCAQLGHESNGLLWMEELADGSDYEGRRDLGNTQPGDGRRFKGRGPIQVTGRHNYTELSRWAHDRGLTPSPTFFVDNPNELASDRYGFVGAVWYWTAARPQLNSLADARDIAGATRAINGGTTNLPDRQLRYMRCLELGTALLPGGTVTNFVEEGVAQLHPTPGLLRKINRPQNVNESTRNPDSAWPGAVWADVWNETVWDGYDIRPEYADVPDDIGRSLVALVQTVAARQVRIEQKIDRLLEGK